MSKIRKAAWFYLEHQYEKDVDAGNPDIEEKVLNSLYTITSADNASNKAIGREAVFYNSATLPVLPESNDSEISVLAKDIIQCAFEYATDIVVDKNNYNNEDGHKKLYDVISFLSGPVFTYFCENIDNPPVMNSAKNIHPLERVTKLLSLGYQNSKQDYDLNAEFTFRAMIAHSLQPKGHMYSGLQKEVREKYIYYMKSGETDPVMRLEMAERYPEVMNDINKKPKLEDALQAAEELTSSKKLNRNDHNNALCICASLKKQMNFSA